MIIATLCFVRNKGKTLMLHRTKKENDSSAGKYIGLGGKIDAGETPEECVIREVYEESGLKIQNPVLKGVLTFSKSQWYVFVFEAHKFSGTLIEDSKEGDLHWIDDSELHKLNLWTGDRFMLNWLNKGFFSGKFEYAQDKLLNKSVCFY